MKTYPIRIIACVIFLGASWKGASQLKEKKAFVSLGIGPSFPIGKISQSDFSDEQSGFANPGASIKLLQAGYRFTNRIGIALSWTGTSFLIDEESIKDHYEGQGATNVRVDAKPWGLGFIGAGPTLSFYRSEGSELELWTLIGSSLIRRPSSQLAYETTDGSGAITYISSVTYEDLYSVGFNPSLLYKYRFNNWFGVILSLDYYFVPYKTQTEMADKYIFGEPTFDENQEPLPKPGASPTYERRSLHGVTTIIAIGFFL